MQSSLNGTPLATKIEEKRPLKTTTSAAGSSISLWSVDYLGWCMTNEDDNPSGLQMVVYIINVALVIVRQAKAGHKDPVATYWTPIKPFEYRLNG